MSNTTFVIDRPSSRKQGCFGPGARRLSSADQIHSAISAAKKGDLWVVLARSCVNVFLKSVTWPAQRKMGNLLVLGDVPRSQEVPLSLLFDRIAVTLSGTTLSCAELKEVISAENRSSLFISGTINKGSGTLTLWRGDLTPLVVPLSAFRPTGSGERPDFDRFAVTDYGQTLRFGDYEASADAVLYEYDPVYRRTLTAQRRKTEKGFGPSLRRLRMQKGLHQDQFSGLSAKTIARLERGKISRPRGRTLDLIAKRLDVKPDEIETY